VSAPLTKPRTKGNKSQPKTSPVRISAVDVTDKELCDRAGLSLFVKYIEQVDVLPLLASPLGFAPFNQDETRFAICDFWTPEIEGNALYFKVTVSPPSSIT